MVLNLGAHLHRMMHGGGGSDEREVRALHAQVEELFRSHNLLWEEGLSHLVDLISKRVLETFNLESSPPQSLPIRQLLSDLISYEELLQLPVIDWNRTRSVSEWWELKDELIRQSALFDDFDATCDGLRLFACSIFDAFWSACPGLLQEDHEDGITVPSDLIHLVSNLGEVVHHCADVVHAQDFDDPALFSKLRPTLECNLITASGGNPRDPKSFSRAPKYANTSDIRDPKELVRRYLGGTPLAQLFDGSVNFTIPSETRFEHHHIVAGSGHGKTQTLQYMIAKDIEEAMVSRRSIIVLDSQGDLIRNISSLAVFGSDGPLHDRIVIIDPTDVEYPVSLNLFDVGQERLSGYAPLERERLTNSILELYDFVLGTLLEAQMTQKQSVIFRYVTRLMLHIPGATIHTLRELMEPGAETTFAPHIAKLSGSAKHFFETEFSSREFEQTKRQVLRRLWGILENQTFERMFSHPQSKLNLFSEMNAGKVILINTAKDLLKESGTEIFGRFFIALIAQAAQERAVLPKHQRTPTFVYIDEAADYLDRNVGLILSQARKYHVGMVLAHQYMGQLSPSLQEAFAANTSIKFAGGVSAKDARTLAGAMYCEPSFIEAQGKGSFAAHIRGRTKQAVPLSFTFGFMEAMPQMSAWDREALQERMRTQYAVHYTELGEEVAPAEEKEPLTDPNEPTPYW